VISRSHQ